ncbi:phosphonatase-like hydrolase [Streptomyces sp. NPDC004752]
MTSLHTAADAAIELAVLDIAGTTIDEGGTVYRILAEAVTAAGATPTSADISRWTGTDKREAVRGLLSAHGSAPDDAEVARVYADFRRRLDAAYRADPPRPLAGAEDVLRELRGRGVKVALSTGFDSEVTDAILGPLGWRGTLVDAVVSADQVARGRPAPYLIFRAMELTGVLDVGRVLVAGDTVADLLSGTNAGAAVVAGVLSGADDSATLGRIRHTHLLTSIADLPALLAVALRLPEAIA